MLRTSSALGAIRNYNDYLTAASVPHQCVSFRELTKPQLDHRRGSIQLRALTRPDTAVRPHWPHDLTSKTAYHQRGLKLARFQLPYPPDQIVREVGAARHQSPRSTFENITALTTELFVCRYDHSTYCLQDDCVSHLTFWLRNYFFLILAHPVYKIWITQEPNMLELWNKLHFEEEKTESIYHV